MKQDTPKPKGYDHTVVRCAGNILSDAVNAHDLQRIAEGTFRGGPLLVGGAVKLARAVVRETIATEPNTSAYTALLAACQHYLAWRTTPAEDAQMAIIEAEMEAAVHLAEGKEQS